MSRDSLEKSEKKIEMSGGKFRLGMSGKKIQGVNFGNGRGGGEIS